MSTEQPQERHGFLKTVSTQLAAVVRHVGDCVCPPCQSPIHIHSERAIAMPEKWSVRVKWQNNAVGQSFINIHELDTAERRFSTPMIGMSSGGKHSEITINMGNGKKKQVHGFLTKPHLHIPAEHVFDNVRHDAEFHFVFENAMGIPNAVLGVPIKIGAPNPMLQLMLDEISLHDEEPTLKKIDFSPLMPENKAMYLVKGSRTAPATERELETNKFPEGVQWVLMQNTVEASRKQLDQFMQLIGGHNSRPLQPISRSQKIYKGELKSVGLHEAKYVDRDDGQHLEAAIG